MTHHRDRNPELVSAFESNDITTLRELLTSTEFELEDLTWAIIKASHIGSIELVQLIASKGVSLEAIKMGRNSTVLSVLLIAVKHQVYGYLINNFFCSYRGKFIFLLAVPLSGKFEKGVPYLSFLTYFFLSRQSLSVVVGNI